MKRFVVLTAFMIIGLVLSVSLGAAGATGASTDQSYRSFGSCQNSQHPQRQKQCKGGRAFGYFQTAVEMRYTFCLRQPDLPNGHRGHTDCVHGQLAEPGTLYANRFHMNKLGTYTLSWYMQLPKGERTEAAASGPATLNGMPQMGYAQITRVK